MAAEPGHELLAALEEGYRDALRSYLAGDGEAALERAYAIGRALIGAGLGVVELAGLHARALGGMGADDDEERDGSAMRFLAEALAPYEMTLRGYEELNRTLEVRVQERTRELERAQAMFHQAQKMETVGRLAGGVAHDFNNLLSVMMMNAELTLTAMAADDPSRAGVEEILQATSRAAQLTRQLLAFSRKQILTPTVLSLNDVVTGIESMLRRLLGESVALDTELAARLEAVSADRGQIEQVIMNLVVNARDAMPDGGVVTLRTSMRGGEVVLEVVDTGTGIAPEHKERIFEPFFTTKPEGRGTGLGLATCYGIVKQSGGTIEVESELGQGTRFQVALPAVHDEESAPERAPPPAVEGRPARILIVDDDAALRRATERTLVVGGHHVVAAAGGEEALRLLEEAGDGFDVLLTDIAMPGMNGRELADRARRIRPELRVIYTSGYSDDEVLARGISTADVELLQKPVRPADLLAKVRDVLTR